MRQTTGFAKEIHCVSASREGSRFLWLIRPGFAMLFASNRETGAANGQDESD